MRRIVGFAAVPLLLLGCVRGSATRDGAADTTAVVPAPSAAPVAVPAAPVDSSSKKGTDTKKAPASPHVGYDSAFGPSFTVDSTGKITPIGTKKKP